MSTLISGVPFGVVCPFGIRSDSAAYIKNNPPPAAYPLALNLPCASGTLTTSNGQIVDPEGNVVVLKGFALSGFEIGLTMSGDLTEGKDSIAHDWDTVMYRYICTRLMFSQS